MSDQPTATLEALQHRARLLEAVRNFFRDNDYWEVETPLLSQETCVDAWLDPFEVHTPERRFLQTSPEFGMKRLLAAGADCIYQITRSFRAGEVGPRHNPEFTIVEWYRQHVTYHHQMDFTEALVRHVVAHVPTPHLPAHSRSELAVPLPRLSFDTAFEQALGSAVLSLPQFELLHVAQAAFTQHQSGPLPPGLEDDRDGLLNLLLATFVEPYLKTLGACFLYDFPESQAALAQVRPASPPVAERFELYLGDLEICNGYQELTDPTELRQRIQIQNARRTAAGKAVLPPESRLLQALDSGYPPSSGVALGLDRLLMWLLNQNTIQSVQAFPWPVD